MTIPAYLPYYIFIGGAAIIAAILFGLRRAIERTDWSIRERNTTFYIAAIILIGWYLLAILLGGLGLYHAVSDRLPTIQYGILLPILIGGVLLWRSTTVSRIVDALPQSWIVGVQFYRALGVMFLILHASGKLPGMFAWPAGIGDIVVGLLAPLVAWAYTRAPRQSAILVLAWNALGIADLIVAVTTGFLTAPSPWQLVSVQPTSELMSVLPLVVIPTFAVPLSILLHLASLIKLRRSASQAQSHGDIAIAPA